MHLLPFVGLLDVAAEIGKTGTLCWEAPEANAHAFFQRSLPGRPNRLLRGSKAHQDTAASAPFLYTRDSGQKPGSGSVQLPAACTDVHSCKKAGPPVIVSPEI